MYVRSLEIERFGKLRNLCTGPRPLGPLVVVVGPNESGKSTLFHFLGSMLYGFYPATRDANPYAPWGDGDIEGMVRLETRDGTELEVRRRLLSSPDGVVLREDRETSLRNQTVSAASHVPREVFEQVYALSLAELADLGNRNGGGWSQLEDRLLAGMGARDLRPPREVVDELEEEAGRLWRPNRRGNQRVRELDREAAALRKRRREAREEDRELRERVRRLEKVRSDLRDARLARQELRVEIGRAERLVPLRRRLSRLEELERTVEAVELPADFPDDPRGALEELERRWRQEKEKLAAVESEGDELRASVADFTPSMDRLVSAERNVRSLVSRAASSGTLLTSLGGLDQEIRDHERRAGARARSLFTVPLEEVDTEPLRGVRVTELRAELRRYREIHEAERIRREAERRLEALGGAGGTGRFGAGGAVLLASGVVGALALLFLVLWAAGGDRLFLISSSVCLLLGGGLLALWWARLRRGRVGPEADEADGRDGAGNPPAEAEALASIRSRLEGLPLRDDRLETPDEELAGEIERLQELLGDLDDRRRRKEELLDSVGELRAEMEVVARRAELELPEDASAAGHVLGEALDRARAAREAARMAERRLERWSEEREAVAKDVDDLVRESESLERRLRELGDGDAARGIDVVERVAEARKDARSLRRETEREYPGLEEETRRLRRAERSEEEWLTDEGWIARRRTDLDEIQDRIERLGKEAERLSTEIEHARDLETVDQIDGALENVEERRIRLAEERDRKWLLAQVVKEADRRFREANQPAVIRRAGRYLEVITDGRYDRLLLADDPDRPPFSLRQAECGRIVPVGPPLSTGTRDQVYLALRLAAVDHLDAGGEPLPLFVDEVFVNWDDRRISRGFDLLETITEKRQLFVFTCHESVVDRLSERGARVLRLTDS